jgi:hypothetical protein
MKVQAAHLENGVMICNICGNPANNPYRYQTPKGDRGCVSECHDVYVRINTKPDWMPARYVLPKWITDCRRAIRERMVA